MRLFIRVQDGQPFEHPILEDNFRQAFPEIDINDLPPGFANFIRVPPPEFLDVYEVYEGVTYESCEEGFMDVHHVRQMTDAEKLEKQNAVKTFWAENGFSSWIFNEKTCSFDPPVPYPKDEEIYIWDEESKTWQSPS